MKRYIEFRILLILIVFQYLNIYVKSVILSLILHRLSIASAIYIRPYPRLLKQFARQTSLAAVANKHLTEGYQLDVSESR